MRRKVVLSILSAMLLLVALTMLLLYEIDRLSEKADDLMAQNQIMSHDYSSNALLTDAAPLILRSLNTLQLDKDDWKAVFDDPSTEKAKARISDFSTYALPLLRQSVSVKPGKTLFKQPEGADDRDDATVLMLMRLADLIPLWVAQDTQRRAHDGFSLLCALALHMQPEYEDRAESLRIVFLTNAAEIAEKTTVENTVARNTAASVVKACAKSLFKHITITAELSDLRASQSLVGIKQIKEYLLLRKLQSEMKSLISLRGDLEQVASDIESGKMPNFKQPSLTVAPSRVKEVTQLALRLISSTSEQR